MKTETVPFVAPVKLAPPDPVAAAAAAARAAFEGARHRAGIATSDLEQARVNLESADRALAEQTARRQKEAEREAAETSAAERAAPLRARADELAAGIGQALRWIGSALTERSKLNSQLAAIFPDQKFSSSFIRPLDDATVKTRGRFSTRFDVWHD